jgi:hypothetical protein
VSVEVRHPKVIDFPVYMVILFGAFIGSLAVIAFELSRIADALLKANQ